MKLKNGIGERSPGHWAIVLEHRDAATGKRRRVWHSFKGGKRAAIIERARLISAMQSGTYLEPSKTSLAVYLDHWLAHIKSQVSPRSHERYCELARKNVVPLLGAVHLTKLKPAMISGAYTKALTTGRRDGRGGLSPRTVTHMHRILKQALGQAVRWEMLTRNPADACDPPKVEWAPMKTYDIPQTAELIEALRGTSMLMPALLAVLCGLRRGEIAALRWCNVDLTTGQMSIVESAEQTAAGIRYKSPKSGKGRTVALSTTMVEELRAHRIERAQQILRLGVRMTDDEFVVGQPDGTAMQPTFITHQWVKTIRSTSLAHLRFHDLRHAHATHMLASGVHPKVASERLGHSKVGITLDLYSHVMPGMQEGAAALVDDALRAAIAAVPKPVR
jgi:integrase